MDEPDDPLVPIAVMPFSATEFSGVIVPAVADETTGINTDSGVTIPVVIVPTAPFNDSST